MKKDIRQYLTRLSQYDFLWKDDMQRVYAKFMEGNPDIAAIRKEVKRLKPEKYFAKFMIDDT